MSMRTPANPEPLFYTPAEVAELLKVHQKTVTRWIGEGSLRAVTANTLAACGKRPVYRVRKSDLDEFVERRLTGEAPAPAVKLPKVRRLPRPVKEYV